MPVKPISTVGMTIDENNNNKKTNKHISKWKLHRMCNVPYFYIWHDSNRHSQIERIRITHLQSSLVIFDLCIFVGYILAVLTETDRIWFPLTAFHILLKELSFSQTIGSCVNLDLIGQETCLCKSRKIWSVSRRVIVLQFFLAMLGLKKKFPSRASKKHCCV